MTESPCSGRVIGHSWAGGREGEGRVFNRFLWPRKGVFQSY